MSKKNKSASSTSNWYTTGSINCNVSVDFTKTGKSQKLHGNVGTRDINSPSVKPLGKGKIRLRTSDNEKITMSTDDFAMIVAGSVENLDQLSSSNNSK